MPEPKPKIEKLPAKEEKVLDFFEKNRDFFITYAGDPTIRVEKSPEELDTFAIDLEKGVLYGDPKYFEDKGYGEDKAFLNFLHEFEHFREMVELLKEKDGERIWRRNNERYKKEKRFKIFDNCIDDIRMDRSVISRAPTQEPIREKLFKENLFPETDFTKMPKHLQFIYTILREKSVPNEKCKINKEVREEIEKLENIKTSSGISLPDYLTRPDIPPSMRLKLQTRYLEPIYNKFFKEDVEDKKGKGKGEGKGNGKPGPSEGEPSEGEPENPEDYFKDEYDEFFDKNPDSALDPKQIKEAVKKWKESEKGKQKSEKEMLEEAYAREQGVDINDIRAYQRFWEQIEEIRNPETDERVVEELREIFRKIISERIKPIFKSKLPVEEGEILIKPAEAVIAVKRGEKEPKVWETLEKKEKPRELYGEFDVTVVVDRSGSMRETDETGAVKYIEQRKAVILLLEALKEFSDDLDEVRKDLKQDLEVRTEVWSFGSQNEVGILKPLSKELTEKQRVAVFKTLDNTPGSTMDFLALEGIKQNIPEEDLKKIEDKKLRKIVIVLTDGASDDSARVQKVLGQLRESGVAVIGVGITKAAEAIKTTYKPDAQICERADRLASALSNLLKDFLAELRV